MRLPAALIDHLPLRLWHPANLSFGGRLHLCIASSDDGATTVRTVEWNGREIGRGRRALDLSSIPDPHGYLDD